MGLSVKVRKLSVVQQRALRRLSRRWRSTPLRIRSQTRLSLQARGLRANRSRTGIPIRGIRARGCGGSLERGRAMSEPGSASQEIKEAHRQPRTAAEAIDAALAFMLDRRWDLAHAGDDTTHYYRVLGALQDGTATPAHVYDYLTNHETRRRLDSSGVATDWWGFIVLAVTP